MKINILTLSGLKFEHEVRAVDTVEQLKLQLARSQQVDLDQVKLLFKGKAMTKNQETVSSYDVKEGDTVHMVTDHKVTMNVTVDMPDGKSKVFAVGCGDQVDMLKTAIQNATGYKIEHIDLIFEGKVVQGGKLSHHDIKDGSKLQLRLKRIEVTVRTFDGKKLTMEISHSETVEEFKTRLQSQTGVPVMQQRLVCNGRQLNNGLMVDHGLQCGSIINMAGRLRGG